MSYSKPSTLVSYRLIIATLILALTLTGISAVFAQDSDEITVTHAQGETVLAGVPEVVITFDLASLSTLHVLGIEVAGVPDFAFPESLEQYASDDYAKVGSLFEPDYEAVNALEPDLIIVAARSSTAYEQLSEIAPTIDLTANNADYLGSQRNNAVILGEIFGKQEEVAALWEDIDASVEAVNELTAEAGNALIVMTSGGEVTAYGPGSRFGWIHDVLGFTPVIEDIEEATHGEAISFEFILEANPDWLIVVDRDIATGESSQAAAEVLDNELVAQTTAWASGQVIYIDPSNWYIVMGGTGAIQEMVEEIHVALDPEAAEEEAEAEATEEPK